MENEIEIREHLSALEEHKKSVDRRLSNLEKLTESVHIIATETQAMRRDVNDMDERLSEVERKPQKRYDTIVTAFITALVGGLIGYFLGI